MPFIFVNGVMQKVPEPVPTAVVVGVPVPSAPPATNLSAPPLWGGPVVQPMAVACSVDQLYQATTAAQDANIQLIVGDKTIKEIERFNNPNFGDSSFGQKYKSPTQLNGEEILSKIGFVFEIMK